MKERFFTYTVSFLVGSGIYPLIEIAFRGYTHPSMAVLGGVCLCAIVFVDRNLGRKHLFSKAALSALMITELEFICGVIVNLWLRLSVWDYADRPGNVAGQICPLFTFFWFLLSLVPLFLLSFGKERRQRKLRLRPPIMQ